MKKEKEKKELKKAKYLKPVLTKHEKLRDITASRSVVAVDWTKSEGQTWFFFPDETQGHLILPFLLLRERKEEGLLPENIDWQILLKGVDFFS